MPQRTRGKESTRETRIAKPCDARVSVVHAHAHGRKRPEGRTRDGAEIVAHSDARQLTLLEVEERDDTHNDATR